MEIKNYTTSTDFILPVGSFNDFKIGFPTKESETVTFLKELYTYPPKFKIVWEQLDELNHEKSRLVSSTNRTIFSVLNEKSSFTALTDSYLNKTASFNFYKKNSNKINFNLQNIPIYIIVNGRGEIVFANSNLNLKSEDSASKLYDFCGSFDNRFTKLNKLSLLFFSRTDAEVYLKEIAKVDPQGTNKIGLSIHCIGLNSAYTLLREYHSDLDFRFVPNLDEVNKLLTSIKKCDSRFIFASDQQQLRYRTRKVQFPINLLSGFRTVEQYFSPFTSFIESGEYFKGVPIYIVQVRDIQQNFTLNSASNLFSLVESVYATMTKWIALRSGFGQSWLVQGKVDDFYKSNEIVNYILFDKDQAIQLTKKFGRRVIRHSGDRVQTPFISKLSRKSKIYVYNLEDFLELWDESTLSNIGLDNAKSAYFIPSLESNKNLDELYSQPSNSFTKSSKQFVSVKFKILIGFFSTLFNNN